MSGPGFFDEQDEGEFRDIPDEVSGQSPIEILQQQPVGPIAPRRAPATPPAKQHPTQLEAAIAEYGELQEWEDADEDDYSAVLSDARLRLEQGRLYEMIMNHDLFEGMDSDPAAVKHVQRQIRKFAKEQMEIMLGMRKETTQIERLEIDFPFNQVEVQVLKMLADKASGGKSANSDRYVPEVTRTTEEVENIPKKPQKLNSIVGKKSVPKPQAPVAKQSLAKTATKPIARKPITKEVAQILAEEQVSPQELEPNYKPLEKPLHEYTADELLKRNQETAERRNKQVKNPSALPMPTYDQEAMLHTTRLVENAGGVSAVNLILAAMNNKKK